MQSCICRGISESFLKTTHAEFILHMHINSYQSESPDFANKLTPPLRTEANVRTYLSVLISRLQNFLKLTSALFKAL